MMDTKGREIAYQVAWKAAVELVTAGKVNLTDLDTAGDEIAAVADGLFSKLEARLVEIGGAAPSAPVAQAAPRQAQAPSQEPPLLTDSSCPECASAGRSGVLLHNTTGRGPEFKCSLQKSRKAGDKWVEVGECSYTDWGANGKF